MIIQTPIKLKIDIIMKRIVFLILLLIGVIITYVVFKEYSFSPLKKRELEMLFPYYKGKIEKEYDIDFIGMSSHSEFFELYSYTTSGIPVRTTYPIIISKWENKTIGKDAIISKWKKCPIDSVTNKLYEFSLMASNPDKEKYFNLLNSELRNPNNYYAYIYFNELENYFLLYSTKNKKLYYIRRKGF